MASDSAGAPRWGIGDISVLVAYVQKHSDDPDDLDRLIALLGAAVRVWRTDPLPYAEHFGFFADLLYMRHGPGGGAQLDRAAQLWREARAIEGVTGLVANRLRLLGLQLDVAVARRDGGPEAMARQISEHCAILRTELVGLVAPSILGDIVRNVVRWADMAADDERWDAAADAGVLAARAAAQLYRSVEVGERVGVVASFRTVAADAASCLLRAGRAEEAVVVLEAARQQMTRFVRDAGDLDRVLRPMAPALLERYRAEMAEWRTTSSGLMRETDAASRDAATAEVRQLEAGLAATLGEIRVLPGLERYQLPSGFEEVRSAADPFPVLYIWSSRHDTSLALVLPDGTIEWRSLPEITPSYLAQVLGGWVAALAPDGRTDSRQRADLVLAIVGGLLETSIGKSLEHILTRRFRELSAGDEWRWGPVTLVVSGPLSFVPVHAWTPYVADETGRPTHHMPLMYAPSARQALRARRSPRPTGASRRLLSVADPAGVPGLAPLPCARLESTVIAETAADARLLHGEAATPGAFMRLAPQYEVLHLACHGAAVPVTAGGARFELAGGALTAAAIVGGLDLDAALVVLSACRSGEQDSIIPEESLDLGSMFLAAGARGVVANLWPVDDLAAALFVWRLFDLWDWGGRLPIHAAVHAARLWLRDCTVAELEQIASRDARWQRAVTRYTRFLPPGTRRFGEPYYWAAFAYSGG